MIGVLRSWSLTLFLPVWGMLPAQDRDSGEGALPNREWSGAQTAIREPRCVVVVNPRSWRRLWQEHAPQTLVPELDFSRWVVLCAFHLRDQRGRALRIGRVSQGGLGRVGLAHHVFLERVGVGVGVAEEVFHMVCMERTRIPFRLLAPEGAAPGKRWRELRTVVVPGTHRPKASLHSVTRRLLAQQLRATAKQRESILVRILAFGDLVRPILHRLLADRDLAPAARRVLSRMDELESRAEGQPIEHCEIALQVAAREIMERSGVRDQPLWLLARSRRVGGAWLLELHGSFSISRDSQPEPHEDLHAQLRLRVRDRQVVTCRLWRGAEARQRLAGKRR